MKMRRSFYFHQCSGCEHYKTIRNSNCHQCYHPLASCLFRERDRNFMMTLCLGKRQWEVKLSHRMTAVREEDWPECTMLIVVGFADCDEKWAINTFAVLFMKNATNAGRCVNWLQTCHTVQKSRAAISYEKRWTEYLNFKVNLNKMRT